MYDVIKERFDAYKKIHDDILPRINHETETDKAKILLENSLYLSIFTTFEWFLRSLIDSYVTNITEEGICFIDLSEGIAKNIFLSHESRINAVFRSKSDKQNKAFNSFYSMLKDTYNKSDLEPFIHFEFLDKSKLDGYYKDVFAQMLGDPDFLDNLMVEITVNDAELTRKTRESASKFLSEFTEQVRNNIAHENSEFKMPEQYSFDSVIDRFLQIVKQLEDTYKNYTKFEVTKTSDNLLEIYNSYQNEA